MIITLLFQYLILALLVKDLLFQQGAEKTERNQYIIMQSNQLNLQKIGVEPSRVTRVSKALE